MNAEQRKSASSINPRKFRPLSRRSLGSLKESAEVGRVLEQVRNALVRLEIELERLEAILHMASQSADQDDQERIQ